MNTTLTPPQYRAGEAEYRHYAKLRRRGQSTREARDGVFRQFAITGSSERETLARDLAIDERAHGIAEPAPEPPVDEQPEPEPAPDPIDAVEHDARGRLAGLREKRQRLAPEALTDSDVAAEVKLLDDEIAAAERAAELAPLAREELARREREKVQDADGARREQARKQAAAAAKQRPALAAAVDAAAAAFAKALADFARHCDDHARQAQAAGMDASALRFKPLLAEKALRRAAADAGAPPIEPLRGFRQGDRLLSEIEGA